MAKAKKKKGAAAPLTDEQKQFIDDAHQEMIPVAGYEHESGGEEPEENTPAGYSSE